MNRKLTALLTLVLLNTAGWAAGQDDSVVTLTRISDRLYELTGGRGANGGLYVGDNGLLMIDAKMSEASAREVQSLLESRFPGKPLLYVVSTHSDGDHVTGNYYLPTSATFVAHENCRREFFHPTRSGAKSDWHNPLLAPYIPEITFRTRMDIHLGTKKVELWYFGVGHTKGDTVVYFPEEKTAFLGDQIFLDRVQLIHSYKGGNSFEHVQTLRKMLDTLDADKFCSGHSEMTDRRTIEKHIAQMRARQEKVTAMVEQGRSLEDTMAAFTKEESRLVTSIYAEVTAGADARGWVSIMPPTDLAGWYRVPVPPGGELGRDQWHVDTDKKLLICDGDGGHDMLLLEKQYGDAIFHLEFRYTKIEGVKGYNSGAYVRNSEDGVVWHQAQFGDADGGFLFGKSPISEDENKFFKVLGKAAESRVRPAGQWNTLEIIARGKMITLKVNGEVTCRFDNCGAERGHVGLEGEGYRVEFRNLKVKELD